MFNLFLDGFYMRHVPEKDSTLLKRFLTLHGEELNKEHPIIFEAFRRKFVEKLLWHPDNPASQKLLVDLVGQPSLLTPVTFSKAFLSPAWDRDRINFLKYGYKEALEEGLKEEYPDGSRDLWQVMVSTLQINFLESTLALMKHEPLLSGTLSLPSRIEKRHGPRRMLRYFWHNLKCLPLNFLYSGTCYSS